MNKEQKLAIALFFFMIFSFLAANAIGNLTIISLCGKSCGLK